MHKRNFFKNPEFFRVFSLINPYQAKYRLNTISKYTISWDEPNIHNIR